MERQRIADGVKLIAFAYLLLHLNVNLGTLNLLPDWLGCILIVRALPALGEYEPSALLLRPLGILLALWAGLLWAADLFGASPSLYLPGVIASVIALYFHFQLLTNLADLAEKFGCPERGRLLSLRTVRTILVTLFSLPLAWEKHPVIALCMAAAHIVIAVWLCAVLFSLRRSLTGEGPAETPRP